MRPAYVRPRSLLGDVDSDGYANYTDIEQSAEDLLLWLAYVNIPICTVLLTPESYVYRLKQARYFEADLAQYTKAVRSWM
jgi:hypothetical protein